MAIAQQPFLLNMTRQSINILLTVFSAILVIACGQKINTKNTSSNNQVLKQAEKLTEINFSDKKYLDLKDWVKDTITEDHYKINYLIKGDSTKYDDIYIKCSKDNESGTFHGKNLLQYRRYFIPTFAGETDKHLYFTYGCATDCSALLVFPKDKLSNFKEFFNVVDYNMELGQVLYVTDSTYENENKIYELALFDLKKDKIHKITYNNICGAVHKTSCIDTIIFNKKQVTVKTTLRKSIQTGQEITQTKIIKL